MKAIKHFQTITKHKILVMQECFRVGLYRQGLLLDYDSHGEGKLVGMKMPVRYVVEMFMDRIAACKVYKGAAYKDSDPLIYYNSGKAGDMMHKDTRKLLEKLLHMLAEQGEETVFCYVRREILKKK